MSGCTPDGEWFAFFAFMFEGGGSAIFELRMHVKMGVRNILRRGPAMVVNQDDIVELLEWRKQRLALDGVRYLQVTPVVAKQMVDSGIESCGQTLLDRQPWGKSWYALNVCVFTLQFRHRDYAEDIFHLDLRLGTSSTDCMLREAALTQEMNPALRATTQNGHESPDRINLGVVPLVGGAGTNARCRLRGTVVKHRHYHFRDATTISHQRAATRFDRPGTVAGEGHADVSEDMLHRAMSKTAQHCDVKYYDGWQKVQTQVPLFHIYIQILTLLNLLTNPLPRTLNLLTNPSINLLNLLNLLNISVYYINIYITQVPLFQRHEPGDLSRGLGGSGSKSSLAFFSSTLPKVQPSSKGEH